MKQGLVDYGFSRNADSARIPYTTFPTAPAVPTESADQTVSTLFYFYYTNSRNDRPLTITFEADEVFDYLTDPSQSSGYMMLSEDGYGLNYSVEITPLEEGKNVEQIVIEDSGDRTDLSFRQREIYPGQYKVSMTLKPPADTGRYFAGLYEGYVLLIYQEN